MITQKMIDYIKSLQSGFGPEELAWVSEMKDVINYDEESENIEITNLSVTGVFQFLEEQSFINLLSLSQLCNENDEPYFPALTDQAGKVVKVNDDETGFEYGEVSGGTKLYKHVVQYQSSPFPASFVLVCEREQPFTSFSQFNDYNKVTENGGFIYWRGTNAIYYFYPNFDPDNQSITYSVKTINDFADITDTVTQL